MSRASSEYSSAHKRRIHEVYGTDSASSDLTGAVHATQRSPETVRRELGTACEELQQRHPAPWKEERIALGLTLPGHRSLQKFLAAPVPLKDLPGKTNSENMPGDMDAPSKILPANAETSQSPQELFARTATLLARRIKPGITFMPHAPPTSVSSSHGAAVTASGDSSLSCMRDPDGHTSDLLRPDPPNIEDFSSSRGHHVSGGSCSSQQAGTDIAERTTGPHAATLSEAGDEVTQQSTVSTHNGGAPDFTATSDFSLDSSTTALSNEARAALLGEGTNPSFPEGQTQAPTQSSSYVTLTAPPSRQYKPKKTENKFDSMDHVAFVGLIQQAISSSSEGTQEAVVKLKEIAKGESGFARLQAFFRHMLADRRSAFVRRMQTEGVVRLEAEFYVRWLADCQNPVMMMTNLLHICSPGARDPIRGMGRIAFAFASSLFHFRKDGGGIFEVIWQTSSNGGAPTRSIVQPMTPADEDSVTVSAALIRETMDAFDDSLRAVILRHKAENGSIGVTMRACEKRLSAALASMASRASLDAHCKGWMGSSKWALLQWADRAESASKRAS
ncbi:hypothetical protein DAEQUDRAFT_148398 [Daedalea quercina L-15889]|uniref:Uncharacterized protein n=1 Tax=Daedalea quercina L-15889 TaxID=1314783 RepID=A0A165KME5_9APHY|nr:hypothetical protein DAEQUDRAFT_148398 [Daedalea quercina L-15889]